MISVAAAEALLARARTVSSSTTQLRQASSDGHVCGLPTAVSEDLEMPKG